MGKRIIQRRRGKGTFTFRVRRQAYNIRIQYPTIEGKGKVIKLVSHAGHTAPLALIKVGNQHFYNAAVEGLEEGQEIDVGKTAAVKSGNILSLSAAPIGTNLCNVEIAPYAGGKLVRSSGLSAVVTKKLIGKVVLLLPSKREVTFDENARATVGVIAGGGRTEKPFVKAGKRWHLMKARNKLYPRTSPIKMNSVNHPFGGGRGKNMGKSGIAPRWAPPGRKVGLLRPKKSGRGK
jgi:large subunit ribosomal protein L2